mgnify:CR=1 FL=1
MQPMNLLIIMSDEHSRQSLGCYDCPVVKTPNIDRLAASGTRFANAYSNSPQCIPSRASLATGRYVHEIGAWDQACPYDGRVPGWGHRLQAAGHHFTSIGKLHYRYPADPTGIDEQIIPMHASRSGIGDIFGSVRDELGLPVRQNCDSLARNIGSGESAYIRYDREITDRACQWLKEDALKYRQKPWVLFVSLTCPHYPFIAPPEFFEMYPLEEIPLPKSHAADSRSRHAWIESLHKSAPYDDYFNDEKRRIAKASYFGMCSFVDSNAGKILAALKETGLAESTRVIYTSDHGESLGARGLWGKANMYEESVGIPLILSGPGVPSGKVSSTPVSLADLHPTVLECTGVPWSGEDAELPGRSLFEIVGNPEDPDREIFSEFHAQGAITGLFMVRRGKFKYIHYVDYLPELFDLNEDPEELNDLSASPKHQNILVELKAALRRIVDPEEMDRQAKAEQAALVERHGGREAVIKMGGLFASPPPGEKN